MNQSEFDDEAAREHLDILSFRDDLSTSDTLKHGAYAQANALLALKNVVEDLVEQQRITNLIALGYGPQTISLEFTAAARLALTRMVRDPEDKTYSNQLHPDIAAALGIAL